jgi:hypothetical protein
MRSREESRGMQNGGNREIDNFELILISFSIIAWKIKQFYSWYFQVTSPMLQAATPGRMEVGHYQGEFVF